MAMNGIVAQDSGISDFFDRFLSGYVIINEASFGIGLWAAEVPFSRSVFDITTIHGYRVNNNIITSLGTGFAFYNEGGLLPLFADIRYVEELRLWRRKVQGAYRMSPYLYAKTGVLLPVYGEERFAVTRLFLFPGIGMEYPFSTNLSLNIGAGLFVQYGNYRDSFVKIKTGLVYKPGR